MCAIGSAALSAFDLFLRLTAFFFFFTPTSRVGDCPSLGDSLPESKSGASPKAGRVTWSLLGALIFASLDAAPTNASAAVGASITNMPDPGAEVGGTDDDGDENE